MTKPIDDFDICENYGIPDYRDGDAYKYLEGLGQGALKWELLRRSYWYRQSWDVYHYIAGKFVRTNPQSVTDLQYRFLFRFGVDRLLDPRISSDATANKQISHADFALSKTDGLMRGNLSGLPNVRKEYVKLGVEISKWSIFDEMFDGAEEVTPFTKLTQDGIEDLIAAARSGMMIFKINPFADTSSLLLSIATQIEERRTDDQVHEYDSEGEGVELGWPKRAKINSYNASSIKRHIHALDAALQSNSRRDMAKEFDRIYRCGEYITPSAVATKLMSNDIKAGLNHVWMLLLNENSPPAERWPDGNEPELKGLQRYRLRRSPTVPKSALPIKSAKTLA